MDSERDRALAEIAYCESILAKGGLTVLSDLFRGVSDIAAWDHYPAGDVFDPVSGSQWYYHCHPAEEGSSEHGHFHCFIRTKGAEGSIHHLIAVGVDQNGKMLRLFTVNQWVVGDDWADAVTIVGLLDRFDMAMPSPSYLVNRWLTAVLVAYKTEIEGLLNERDRVLAAHPNADVHNDRSLEVTSSFSV
jgi:hypothetical protein